jgi:rare lipoprotein A
MFSRIITVLIAITLLLSPESALAGAQTMEVSWYGAQFQGSRMANGKVFNKNNPTLAAHKTLPFGTKIRLENPRTNRTLVVVVSDRGPFVRGRDLDISEAAARRLGILQQGVGLLRSTIIT